jgi:hypothetical protein
MKFRFMRRPLQRVTAIATLLLFVFCGVVLGNELPDSPVPKSTAMYPYGDSPRPAQLPYWTRGNKAAVGGMFLSIGADAIGTCHFLYEGVLRERNLTQSCPADVAILVGEGATMVVLSHILHRSERWRKFEKLPLFGFTATETYGAARTAALGGWR